MKVALIYDRVNKWGGAERVLLALHEIFPDAPLYTSVYDPKRAPWAKIFPKVVCSFLNWLPYLRNKHEYLWPLMPFAFEFFSFDDFDLVISVTSESALGVVTKPYTKHICYCLTPTRYLWSGYQEYFDNPFIKFVCMPFVRHAKDWDKVAANRPDKIIAISTEVKERVVKYYSKNSEIIFPPVEFRKFFLLATNLEKTNEFYLVVSRLVKYKKIDVVIKAFNELGEQLVIVGIGTEEQKLRSIAKPNVKFAGQLTDEELASYYSRCKALVFPQEEDFGIVAIEAQVFGKPVIAYKSGGALDTVIDGETGVFFEKQTTESLKSAVNRLSSLSIDPKRCIENARRFSKERFQREFLKQINL